MLLYCPETLEAPSKCKTWLWIQVFQVFEIALPIYVADVWELQASIWKY